MKYEFVVDALSDQKKLGPFLRSCGISCSLLRTVKYLENGLMVDGVRAKTDLVLHAGQRVEVAAPCAPENPLVPCDEPVPVVYESEDVIVYDKPAGMATHPTRNQPEGTLANVYAALMRRRGLSDAFRPTNRLDKNTSGLVLAAKTRFAANSLAKSSDKRYLAIVQGELRGEGRVDAPIGRDPDSIIRRCVLEGGQPSVTEYRVLRTLRGHTLVELHTLTGRTHQIRVHMAYLGHPLAGDDLYGGSRALIGRHALHCSRLWFDDPRSSQRIQVQSEMPQDMQALLERLKTVEK